MLQLNRYVYVLLFFSFFLKRKMANQVINTLTTNLLNEIPLSCLKSLKKKPFFPITCNGYDWA